jgi:diacylglycerol kinase (ATP)
LQPALKRLQVDFEVVTTERPGHAFVLAREATASRQFGVIAAMGGDGTINEVVNGIMTEPLEKDRPTLGILPSGRGRDFCKAQGVKIPADLVEAARVLIGQRETRLDVGYATFQPGHYPGLEGAPKDCHKRYFINIASLGFDAVVTEEANRPPTTWGRKLAPYYTSIFAALRSYRNRLVRYRLDGQPFLGRFNSLIAANGNYYGSGMHIAPGARPHDGLFEIVLLGDAIKPEVVAIAPLLYTGWHRFYPRVKIVSGRKLEIEPLEGEGRLPLQMDGEVVGHAPASFEIVPGAIRIKVP